MHMVQLVPAAAARRGKIDGNPISVWHASSRAWCTERAHGEAAASRYTATPCSGSRPCTSSSWSRGSRVLYLPRLFVYHVSTTDTPARERFEIMERRLFAIMTLGALLTIGLGLAMLGRAPEYLELAWLRTKLVLVALLIVYHGWCYSLMKEPRLGRARTLAALVSMVQRGSGNTVDRDRDTCSAQAGLRGPAISHGCHDYDPPATRVACPLARACQRDGQMSAQPDR